MFIWISGLSGDGGYLAAIQGKCKEEIFGGTFARQRGQDYTAHRSQFDDSKHTRLRRNMTVLLMKRKRKAVLWLIAAVLLTYVSSYATLSFQGQYVPGAWGLGWVKWYIWAPQWFVSGPAGTEQNRLPQMFYLPLWLVDMRFVHTSDMAHDGKHPINELLDQELQIRVKDLEQKSTQTPGDNRSSPDTNHPKTFDP